MIDVFSNTSISSISKLYYIDAMKHKLSGFYNDVINGIIPSRLPFSGYSIPFINGYIIVSNNGFMRCLLHIKRYSVDSIEIEGIFINKPIEDIYNHSNFVSKYEYPIEEIDSGCLDDLKFEIYYSMNN